MFSSTAKHSSLAVSTHFPTRQGDIWWRLGVWHRRDAAQLLLMQMIRGHPRVYYKCLASPSSSASMQYLILIHKQEAQLAARFLQHDSHSASQCLPQAGPTLR